MSTQTYTPVANRRSPIEQARFNMIEQQIRPWDVLDTRVLDLLATVQRERYVPIRYQNLAFVDTEVPLGFDEFMWPPRVEGRCLQALDLKPTDRVLEVGSGSGYLASLIAHQAAHVTSYEINPELARRARNAMLNNGVNFLKNYHTLPSIIFLVLGGAMVALALEGHGLHRRLATGIARAAPPSARGLLLAMMAAN